MAAIDIVGKIGSMALIQRDVSDIDYNILSRISSELRPGVAWVTSGAAEIGRLDYIKRTGRELHGEVNAIKVDYSAQGQAILMASYRQFIKPEYSVRQLLFEHQHFNDAEKREHIRKLLIRTAEQDAIPIINYNDPVSDDEVRKMELNSLRQKNGHVVECVDNDETAAVICNLVHAKYLVLLTSTEGIYRDPKDPDTLVKRVIYPDQETLVRAIEVLQESCVGASREGANGARAKLQYAIEPALSGTTVIIGHARHGLMKLVRGEVDHTRIGIGPRL